MSGQHPLGAVQMVRVFWILKEIRGVILSSKWRELVFFFGVFEGFPGS